MQSSDNKNSAPAASVQVTLAGDQHIIVNLSTPDVVLPGGAAFVVL